MTCINNNLTTEESSLLCIPKLGPKSLKRADLRDTTYAILSLCIHTYINTIRDSDELCQDKKNANDNYTYSDFLPFFTKTMHHISPDQKELVYLFEYDVSLKTCELIQNLPVSTRKSLTRAINIWYQELIQKQKQKGKAIFPCIPIQFSDLFFAHDTRKEQSHSTPYELNRLMAGLIAPMSEMHIYDPACGSGGSLLACYQHAYDITGNENLYTYGHDINMRICSLARKNLYLQGIKNTQIEANDAILSTFTDKEQELIHFDRCICEIPRSPDMSHWNLDNLDVNPSFSSQTYRSRQGEITFLEHMLYLLKPDGKMAVIVPHEFLYSGGNERIFRKELIHHHHLIAVIYLPEKVLFSSDEAPALLIIGKERNQSEKTLFIDASQHYIQEYKRNTLTPETIQTICSVTQQGIELKGFSSSVSSNTIADEEYRLTVSRYVDSLGSETLINVRSVLKDLQTLEAHRKDTSQKIEKYLKIIGYTN